MIALPSVTLSPPSAAGVFISRHTQVQQPSVSDCQGVENGCAALGARQSTNQNPAQVVGGMSDGKSPAPTDKTDDAFKLPKFMDLVEDYIK